MEKDKIKNENEIKNEIKKNEENILKKSGEIINIENSTNPYFNKKNVYISNGVETLANIAKNKKINISDLKIQNPLIDENTTISKGTQVKIDTTLTENEKKQLIKINLEIQKKMKELEILKGSLQEKIILKLEIEAGKINISNESLQLKSSEKSEYLGNKGTQQMIEFNKKFNPKLINEKALKEYKNKIQELKEVEQLLASTDSSLKTYREYYQTILFDIEKYRTSSNLKQPIPKKTLLLLLIIEGSKGSFTFDGPGSAYGIGQITNKTWFDVKNKNPPYNIYKNPEFNTGSKVKDIKDLPPPNKEEQLKAICMIIDAITRKYNCNPQDALKYYNMGLSGGEISKDTLHKYIKGNIAIAGIMVENKLKENKLTLKKILNTGNKKGFLNQITDCDLKNDIISGKATIENSIDNLYKQGMVKIENIRGFINCDKYIDEAHPTVNHYITAANHLYGGGNLKINKINSPLNT